jgi:hypothetical protein
MLEDQEQAERRSGQEYQRMLREIERLDPGNALVVEWRRSQENPTPGIGEAARVRTLLGCPEGTEPEVSRKLVEQAAILDNLRTTTTQGAVVQFRKQGDVAAADSILAAADYAMKSLGIADVRAVEDFPIGLVAAGYTRVSANPDDSMLVPYPAVSGRTPLHVVASLTEAIYCQLDPLRVIGWLNDNGLASFEAPSESADGWSLLYRSLPGLRYSPNHPSHDEPAAAAVRTLLHTMSHVLLRHIEWSGYAPQSIGEYMLPGGLAFVLYASRYTATKVGGLLTLFEQHLGLWLQECFQEGRDCMYDPFCREDGGSCVGCLHREYNCPSFNGELSRATLYGGPCPREGRAALPFRHIARGYWEER